MLRIRGANQVLLLRDIRDAFDDSRAIFTDDLLSKLNAIDDSPWGGRRRGEGMDARGLARLLRPFGIKPKSVRVEAEHRRGYHVDQFADVFARHLSEAGHAGHAGHPASHGDRDVTDVTDKSTPLDDDGDRR